MNKSSSSKSKLTVHDIDLQMCYDEKFYSFFDCCSEYYYYQFYKFSAICSLKFIIGFGLFGLLNINVFCLML